MGINAMHVAKTGLNAQQVRMQIISNNLANVVKTVSKKIEQILSPYFIKSLEAVVLKHQLILNLPPVFPWVQVLTL